jgi:sodium pump decarboxylase gamma subunit
MIFGLTVALIGMGTVFFALVLLVGVIRVQSCLVALAVRRKVPKAAAAPAAPAAAPVPAGDDGEVLAVIAAGGAALTREP